MNMDVPNRFEGHRLDTVVYQGRRCWLASQVARALGYDNPGKLSAQINGSWSDEFEDCDSTVLTGQELNDFKHLIRAMPDSGITGSDGEDDLSPYASAATILFEPGLYLVLIKTGQPAGKRLRRWLADEVLPALNRQQVPFAEAQPEPDAENHDPPPLFSTKAGALRWLYREMVCLGSSRAKLERIARKMVEFELGEPLESAATPSRRPKVSTVLAPPAPGSAPDEGRVRQFLAECTEPHECARVRTGDLYDAYAEWGASDGVVNKIHFGRLVGRTGHLNGRSSGVRFWKGLRLKQIRCSPGRGTADTGR